ncbi:MAG TPA: protein-L-isoaspartate(D-aspartate) O-methyltransferase [Methanoregulaceae archaeon]|nr:protein-L-isoaspartate(D-aspartate) O-methyltransferase [Methanoregulaceae archaeon]HOH81466.1 protein-L-isoaspartate(D-aspartate) O-methyltransferase [Methanoregulaceae archaeon]
MTGTDPWESARERMVATQIAARGVGDEKVLAAMRRVPRHLFVPAEVRGSAYSDYPLPIGHGQTISQPYIVAMMTSLLQIQPDDRLLEIGSGSGYQAAVLGILAREVISIERIPEVAQLAKKNLADAGITNVTVVIGDGTLGFPGGAPYNGVLITAATPSIPSPLVEQLAEGGRIVAPVGSRDLQELVRLTRKGHDLTRESFGGVVFVPLLGEYGWK